MDENERPRTTTITGRERERQRIREEALQSVRLPDAQAESLARLGYEAAPGMNARAWGPEATQEEIDRSLQEDRDRERAALEEFRQSVLEREVEAYVLGVESATDREAQRGYAARSMVLLLVVLAVVFMPVLAIFKGLDPDYFGTFIAPITGIAGTVVGFWFSTVGTSGRNT